MTVLWAKPTILAALPHGHHAVIEASAGTGKTYTLEHLVVELILTAQVPLESILVVTYTERAAGELRVRVRKKLRELLEAQPQEAHPDTPAWKIDDEARLRLLRALESFDLASISTIHAFCQSMLIENAFLNRRLFDEHLVDGRIAFSRAFIDALRRDLARDPDYVPYLEAWLREWTLEDLENILFECAQRRGEFRPPFRPEALAESLLELAKNAIDPELLTLELRATRTATQTITAVMTRYRDLLPHLQTFAADRNLPRFLSALAREEENHRGKMIAYLREKLPDLKLRDRRAGLACATLQKTIDLLVPLKSAVAETLLGPVKRELARAKAKKGELDFDDMLALLWSSLAGPRGDELARAIAARYTAALVDEFQDTDDIQWRIFERIFVDRPERDRSLFVIGDPKQSIYGFRGADVHTYLRAIAKLAETGGARVPLKENFRSTVPLLAAINAILDQNAAEPFFGGAIRYLDPVVAARPPKPDDLPGPPVRVFAIASREGELTHAAAKIAHAKRIAAELGNLLADRTIDPSEIFILTRTTKESNEIGRHLRRANIPHAFYKQEGLFQTEEALEILTLLLAIADPEITSRRVRAWMGPFFSVPLEAMPACLELPPTHPLLERLHGWSALAKNKKWSHLFNSIIEDSGILRREIFFEDSERELTNYLHIFELLLEETHRSSSTLEELIHTLAAFIERRRFPEGENGNVQRLESERAAVQIMTMHKAKGLEARVVFVFGGGQGMRSGDVHIYHEGHERLLAVAARSKKEAIQREEDEEERRLLYVAITRAKERLYLPYFEGLQKFDGPYRHLNRALQRTLVEHTELFAVENIAAAKSDDDAKLRPDRESLTAWRPPEPLLADAGAPPELERLRAARAGWVITSYSRMKASAGGYHAPDPLGEPDPGVDVALLAPDELPGGPATGRFLHEILENIPADSFEAGTLEYWAARNDVRALVDAAMKKHDIEPKFLRRSLELVYAGLGAPMKVGSVELPRGIAAADRLVREMEFLYPIPGAPERGFVKGYIDLVFEYRGRIYLVDWKSDLLPSYADDAIELHCAQNYALQAQLYTTALVKMFGIDTRAEYDRLFGGTVYCFLRGMPEHGVRFTRIPWSEVER